VGGRDLREERLGNLAGMGRLFHEIHVVDGPGRVELGHVERIHIPELCLDERAAHLQKPHAHQLAFDQV